MAYLELLVESLITQVPNVNRIDSKISEVKRSILNIPGVYANTCDLERYSVMVFEITLTIFSMMKRNGATHSSPAIAAERFMQTRLLDLFCQAIGIWNKGAQRSLD